MYDISLNENGVIFGEGLQTIVDMMVNTDESDDKFKGLWNYMII